MALLTGCGCGKRQAAANQAKKGEGVFSRAVMKQPPAPVPISAAEQARRDNAKKIKIEPMTN